MRGQVWLSDYVSGLGTPGVGDTSKLTHEAQPERPPYEDDENPLITLSRLGRVRSSYTGPLWEEVPKYWEGWRSRV